MAAIIGRNPQGLESYYSRSGRKRASEQSHNNEPKRA